MVDRIVVGVAVVALLLLTANGAGAAADLDEARAQHREAQRELRGLLVDIELATTAVEDIMKQLAAVQGMLEGTSREVFRHHLETHVADAVREGRGEEIFDELMETLDRHPAGAHR